MVPKIVIFTIFYRSRREVSIGQVQVNQNLGDLESSRQPSRPAGHAGGGIPTSLARPCPIRKESDHSSPGRGHLVPAGSTAACGIRESPELGMPDRPIRKPVRNHRIAMKRQWENQPRNELHRSLTGARPRPSGEGSPSAAPQNSPRATREPHFRMQHRLDYSHIDLPSLPAIKKLEIGSRRGWWEEVHVVKQSGEKMGVSRWLGDAEGAGSGSRSKWPREDARVANWSGRQ